MSLHDKQLGKSGELLATDFLKKNGYEILDTNFSTRAGEIDIIAKKANKLSFIEVKTRTNLNKGFPYEAVTPKKIQRILSVAKYFLLKNSLNNYKLSIGIISVIFSNDNSEIKFIENIDISERR